MASEATILGQKMPLESVQAEEISIKLRLYVSSDIHVGVQSLSFFMSFYLKLLIFYNISKKIQKLHVNKRRKKPERISIRSVKSF